MKPNHFFLRQVRNMNFLPKFIFIVFMSLHIASPCCPPATCTVDSTNEVKKKKSLHRTFYDSQTKTAGNILKSTNTNPISVSYTDLLELYKPQNDLIWNWTPEGSYQMNIGTVDYENPQTWTMPVFPLNTEPNGDGIQIEDAPGLNHFPEATHCRLYNYSDNGDAEFFYEYYQFTVSGVTLLGYHDTIPAQEWSEHDDYNELITPLPLDINTDFSTTGELTFRDTIYNLEQYVYTEGYGTLTTTYGTEEVLKVRAEIYTTIYDLDYNLLDDYSYNIITFYSKQGTRLILELAEGSPTTGNVNISNVYFERVVQNTAIENIEIDEVKLFYPNPSNGTIWFYEKADYQIYNVSGVLVKTVTNAQTVDLSALSRGIYIIKNNNGSNQKLIIQ